MSNRLPAKPRFGARLLLLAVAVGLSWLVGELAVRLLVTPPGMIRFQQLDDALGNSSRAQFIDLIEPDPERFWRLAPDVSLPSDARPFFGVISNSQGLREDHEIPREKAADGTRILFLGDSVTFGYLSELEQTYVEGTERELKRRLPNFNIECINAGVPGYSLFQGWRLLATEGFDYQPDLVVLASFGWNDADSWDGRSDIEHHAALRAARPPAWLAWSRIAELGFSLRASSSEAASSERPRLTPEEFSGLLERILGETRIRGVDLLMVAGAGKANLDAGRRPDMRTPLQKRQIRFAEQHPLSADVQPGWVDAVAVVQGLSAEHRASELFFDPIHTTPLANAAIAQAMANQIEPWLRTR